MIFQLQYRFKGVKPTKTQIQMARRAFARGETWPGVEVRPMAWTGTVAQLRKALKDHSCYIGEAGIVKQYAEPDLTLCDYDRPTRPPIHVIVRIAKMLDAKILWMREDRTRHGWHVLIRWNRSFRPAELIAIQCVLGSDQQRESYNLARVISGKRSVRWNLLFERKL